MKKFVIASLTSIALLTGGAAIASSEQESSLGAKFTMLKMFAQYHDLSDHQQDLMTEVMIAGKKLAAQVKKPKAEAKAYLLAAIESDQVDVEEILTAYYEWQKGVNVEFEQTLRAAANLHAELSVEQRKNIIESLKQMRKGK